MLEYSVVIPVYNEKDSLRVLWEELQGVFDKLGSCEFIFVDDGSSDGSGQFLDELARRYAGRVRVIHVPQRAGQSAAMKTGLGQAAGRIVFTLDADLQNNPADIPRLLEKMKEGYDVVCGWRKDRSDKPLKTFLSKLGNILQRTLTGLTVHDVSCTLRAYKRECLEKVALSREGMHRFIPLSLSLQGCQIGEIVAHHRERSFGVTKYSHKRIFSVIVDFFRVLFSRGQV